MKNALLLENINDGLKTYSGRDACIRFVAYFFLFLYGLLKQVEEFKKILFYKNSFFTRNVLSPLTHSCLTISKHFSTTRLILRFFDDIPAILKFMSYLNLKQNKVSRRYLI